MAQLKNTPVVLDNTTKLFGVRNNVPGEVPTGFLGLHNMLLVREQQVAGTEGGSFASGAWRTRILNTVLLNNIAGASLASNRITLPAGTYYCEASAPAIHWNEAFRAVAQLYNITGAAVLLHGQATQLCAGTGYGGVQSFSHVFGHFTLSVESLLELQHRAAANTGSFGGAVNVGIPEVYSVVKIWKIA